MVDRGLISEFERSLSSQEGPLWFPIGASLWASWCFNHVSAKPAKRTQYRIQHHKKFVLHCIITDQLHSARMFSLDIISRAILARFRRRI